MRKSAARTGKSVSAATVWSKPSCRATASLPRVSERDRKPLNSTNNPLTLLVNSFQLHCLWKSRDCILLMLARHHQQQMQMLCLVHDHCVDDQDSVSGGT